MMETTQIQRLRSMDLLLQRVRAPKSFRFLSLFIFFFLIGSIAALIFVPWQQNVAGQGRVIAYAPFERQQQIQAPIDGRVVSWFVKEGSTVKAGDQIVQLSDIDPDMLSHLLAEKQALEHRLKAMLDRKQAIQERVSALEQARPSALSAAGERTKMATRRISAAKQGVFWAKSTLDTAEKQHSRQKQLSEEGIASQRTQELAELDYDRALADWKRAQAQLLAAQNEHGSFLAEQSKVEQDTAAALAEAKSVSALAEADVELMQAELARLSVRISRQTSQTVTAPKDGTILRVLVNAGAEVVKMGTPLAIFVPDSVGQAAELWVDGNDIPLVSLGRAVRLQFEGWPAIQFVGWPSTAVGTFGGKVALIDATDDGRGKFRVLVVPDPNEPWPENRYLRQGVRTNGWILLNQVSLGFELWRQWNGFPPSITPPQTDMATTK